ncbi:hypothetical protein EMGBS12_03480 [Methylophilaceae bacterium]|jgi:uncharacterized protein (TIGR03643 family)|nr:hypothetical protein EMGBS12_03480 [Methylophilaceae bacterium]
MSNKEIVLTEGDMSRLIEMAWEDRTPFEAILKTYQLDEPSLMRIMQAQLKPSSYRLWRKRVKEKSSKHLKLRSPDIKRDHCKTQYKISR